MDGESDEEGDQIETDDHLREGSMGLADEDERQSSNAVSVTPSQFRATTSSAGGFDWAKYESSVTGGTPRGIKRSRGGVAISGNSPRSVRKQRKPKRDSPIPAIAKDMAMRLGAAKLEEPDELIIKNEITIQHLSNPEAGSENEIDPEALLSTASQELARIWRQRRDQDQKDDPPEPEASIRVGPDETAPGYQKAGFLGSFLLQLHHPPAARGMQALMVSKLGRSSTFANALGPSRGSYRPTAVPKVMLDWLNENHNPYADAAAVLREHVPNPTAYLHYWDIIVSLVLRGKISDVISIFKHSKFEVARTAREDGQDQIGYQGATLGNIKRVVNRAVQALEMCPALEDDNWDVTGNEWLLFRKRISHALADLTTFAEGRKRDVEPSDSTFEASNFGITNPPLALSQSARRAESQVPWTIYQNLKAMYGIILGGTAEVISAAQDWVEATIGLAVWWDGDEDEDIAVGSLAMTRHSLRRSQSRGSRLVDLNPTEAYLQRLAYAFEQTTEDENSGLLQISSINPVEVGLASIFERNVEGVIRLLRSWSLPIASAVVEVASLGSWYSSAPSTALMDGFDESDLLVLSSYGQREKPMTRDSLLVEYAEALFGRDQVEDPANLTPSEGWELSIEVLARVQDSQRANRKVNDLLEKLPLDSDLRVHKILQICSDFGLQEEACRLSEVFIRVLVLCSLPFSTCPINSAC